MTGTDQGQRANKVFADHEVIPAPDDLRRRAATSVKGPRGPDADLIARAEKALEALGGEFEGWMRQEADRLAAAHAAFAADAALLPRLYGAAHDLRGQAATFGYPMAGEVADNLCDYLDGLGAVPPDPAFVKAHADAVARIVRDGLMGSADPVTLTVIAELVSARERLGRREAAPA